MIRVLVIDDDPAVRVVLQRNLEHAGFDVRTAGDGVRGISGVRESRPDVVVLDLMMPHADGYEVLRQLANGPSTSAIPVIVLTALTEPGVKDRCLEAGARFVITKPFDPDSLASEIVRITRVTEPVASTAEPTP